MQSMIAITQTCNVNRGLPGKKGSPILTITPRRRSYPFVWISCQIP